MAIIGVKENIRLKLELDGGMSGDRQIVKTKTFTKVKPDAVDEDLYDLAGSLVELQSLPLFKVKRLEEVHLKEE